MPFELVDAHQEPHVATIRSLFLEYAESLGFDLCFQNFDVELAQLPGEYAPPEGRLLLALCDGQAAGCVALRRIDAETCEMKRLYVRSGFRGQSMGRALAQRVIDEARCAGYKRMRLDTLPSMQAAVALYESLGFRNTQPYRYNPIPGARFMELPL